MSKNEWKKAAEQPKLPEGLTEMVSNLQQVQALLEKALKRDEANLKTLELELVKIEAQKKARGR